MTWAEANNYCRRLGNSKLVEIDSSWENNAIKAEMSGLARLTGRMTPDQSLGNESAEIRSRNGSVVLRRDKSGCTDRWMGLTDRRREGSFVLESNQRSPSFTDWAPNEPNDSGGNEDCAWIGGRDWNDEDCDVSESYHCRLSALCEET